MSIRDEFFTVRQACQNPRFVSFNMGALAEALSYTAPWRRVGVPDVYEGLPMLCVPDQIERVIVSETLPDYFESVEWFKINGINRRTCLRARSGYNALIVGHTLLNVETVTVQSFTELEAANVPQTILEWCGG